MSRYLGANGVTGTKACRAGGAVGSICVRNCATSTASRKAHTGGESASSGVAVSTLRGGGTHGKSAGSRAWEGGAATCAEGSVRVVCGRGGAEVLGSVRRCTAADPNPNPNPNPKFNPNQVVGRGGYGCVVKAVRRDTGG